MLALVQMPVGSYFVIIKGDMNISNDDGSEDTDDCDDYCYDDNEHGEINVFSFQENPVPDHVVNTTPEGIDLFVQVILISFQMFSGSKNMMKLNRRCSCKDTKVQRKEQNMKSQLKQPIPNHC